MTGSSGSPGWASREVGHQIRPSRGGAGTCPSTWVSTWNFAFVPGWSAFWERHLPWPPFLGCLTHRGGHNKSEKSLHELAQLSW